jgi:phosphate-selective porin OprO/OprP
MTNVKTRFLNGVAFAAIAAAILGLVPPAHAGEEGAKIDALQQQIDELNNQVEDLKRSQNAQYTDIKADRDSDVKVTLKNGRPKFATADGDFTAELRALVQFDAAYYAQGKAPSGTDFSSGTNFRRARFGIDGTLFKDWSYEFIYDFGGSGTEGSTISSAFIQYDGLGPVHIRAGAFPTPESLEDTTSASDLLFLERAQPTDLARGIAGADGREGASIFAYGDDYYAALSYSGGVVGETPVFDEQEAAVGRFAYRLLDSADSNFVVGVNGTDVFKLPDTAAGSSPAGIRFRERPELNVDDNSVRLIDTGTIAADHVWQWGAEAAGNWQNFYGQGGYFGFEATRHASTLPNPSFDGWYVQGSWVLTGESKPYRPEKGAYGLPTPAEPFSFSEGGGLGAWEVAARYSDLDLDYHPGVAGFAAPADGIRGGDQKIWTLGLNWYPNSAIRFVLDYQHTDVSRLGSTGGDAGAHLDAVALRTQLSL